MTRVIINDNNTNRTAPQQPRHRCPEGLEAYKAVPRPVAPIRKPETVDPFEELCSISAILNTSEGQKLGKSPLDFLREHLPDFCSATKIFDTRDHLPRTEVADDFHKACDNVPNVLVIIKSGQYIAGGFTTVAFESLSNNFFKPNYDGSTFLLSVNRRKVYSLKNEDKALWCKRDFGPVFGSNGIGIRSDYKDNQNWEMIYERECSFHEPDAIKGELFGDEDFKVDEYEVYKLE